VPQIGAEFYRYMNIFLAWDRLPSGEFVKRTLVGVRRDKEDVAYLRYKAGDDDMLIVQTIDKMLIFRFYNAKDDHPDQWVKNHIREMFQANEFEWISTSAKLIDGTVVQGNSLCLSIAKGRVFAVPLIRDPREWFANRKEGAKASAGH
jgi:hypothetical protein